MDKSSQQGLSLVELLVSMLLGLLIVSVTIQVALQIKHVYRYQQGLAIIQENARFLHVVLDDAIQTRGKIGCSSLDNARVIYKHPELPDWMQDIEHGLQRPKTIKHQPNTDVLWINGLRHSYPVQAFDGFSIRFKDDKQEHQNKVIAISDCEQISFYQILGVNDGVDILKNKNELISKRFDKNAQAGLLESILFYVNNSTHANLTNQPISSLFSRDLNSQSTQELVQGVEQLEIRYQENGEFKADAQVIDWPSVTKLQVRALLNSINPALTNPKNYVWKQQVYQASDHLLRKEWLYEWELKTAHYPAGSRLNDRAYLKYNHDDGNLHRL